MSLWDDGAKAVIVAMFPRRNPTPDETFIHNATVSGVLLVLISGYAWALGLLVSVGLGTGFAKASEVDDLKQSQTFTQKLVLNQSIRDRKKDQCLAYDQGNGTALRSLTDNLEGLKDEYRAAVHQEPHVPECRELLIYTKQNGSGG